MTSQKLENLLNLALNSAEDEREKSLNLNVGYDPLDRGISDLYIPTHCHRNR